jgi:hypothetical protein
MKFPKYIEPDFSKEPFISAPDVTTEKAGGNYLPVNFYATTIYPEYFKINGEWKMIKESRMDGVTVIKNGEPIVAEPRKVQEGDEVVINCGLDGEPRMSECEIKGYPYKIWAYAYMENGEINAVVKPINTLSTQYMTFDFFGDTVKIQIKGTPSFPEFILKNATSPDFIKKNKAIKAIVTKAVGALVSTTERPMKFKAK